MIRTTGSLKSKGSISRATGDFLKLKLTLRLKIPFEIEN
jgi:hypothetical protein